MASKPVMEGKAVFKRFADIDGIDLEVNTDDADEFINSIKVLGNTWEELIRGGKIQNYHY